MNASSKGVISIGIDSFDNFIKACGIGKRSEARSFRNSKIPVEAITKKL